jgi:hypothetical protein
MDDDALSDDVREAVVEVAGRLAGKGLPRPDWTKEIKRALVTLGKSRGAYTCASGVADADCGEWLFDVCWLDYEKDADRLIRLRRAVIVAESEWGGLGDIEDDFEKLMLVRADLRVLIFEIDHAQAFRKIAEKLKDFAMRSDAASPSDRYLLLGYNLAKQAFDSHSIRLLHR